MGFWKKGFPRFHSGNFSVKSAIFGAMKKVKSFKDGPVEGYKFGSVPIGKPRMFSHVFFIDGLLIDTGHPNMRKEAVAAISTWPVEQIFITHHHEDHRGNLDVLKSHFDCPAYASRRCIEISKKTLQSNFAQLLVWGRVGPTSAMTVEEVEIRTPKYTFELIPIPGHAEDQFCLYEREQGWLFSADLWVSPYIRYFMRSESMSEQIESIKRVLQLDFGPMYCSHNPQFEGGKEKLAQKLQFFEDFYGKAAGLYHEGHSPRRIMKRMGLKESWTTRILSTGALSGLNMVKAVVRDEQAKEG